MEWFDAFIVVFASGMRLAVPLILACLAGLWSERSGIVDIGLEGKILVGAFASAAAATFTGSVWLGLLAGAAAAIVFSLIHGYASIDQRANQIVSGTAINMVADGLTALIGNAIWSQGGRTPQLPAEAQFGAINWPFVNEIGAVPIIGPIYAHLISGHDIITYVAFLLVPLTYWALYSTRFGLRLRAVGENPAAVDTAGISVRGLRYSAVVICGLLVGLAGVYLALGQTGYFQPHMSAGARLHRARRARLRQMAAMAGAGHLPSVRLPRCAGDPLAGGRTAGHRTGPGAGDRSAALYSHRRVAGGLHRQGDSAQGVGNSLCQRALRRRLPNCSPPPRPRKPTPMRPIRVSRSARPCARLRAQFFRAATSRTPLILKGPAPKRARSRRWRSLGNDALRKSSLLAMATLCARRVAAVASASANSPILRPLIHIAGPEGVRAKFTLDELLPESFGPDHLAV